MPCDHMMLPGVTPMNVHTNRVWFCFVCQQRLRLRTLPAAAMFRPTHRYILSCTQSLRRKTNGFKLGDKAGHVTGPVYFFLPISTVFVHVLRNISADCGGDRPCCIHIRPWLEKSHHTYTEQQFIFANSPATRGCHTSLDKMWPNT
jgi:hypothetical protein